MPFEDTINIENEDFYRFDVPGNGDCFFHCLSLELHGRDDFRRVAQLKNKICNHVFNNWASFEVDVHACHNSSLTKSSYLNFMLVQRNWASACEIKAASEILNQPIKVFLKGRASTKLVYNKSLYVPTHCHLTPPITLLLSDGHFQLLKKVSLVRGDNDHTYATALACEPKNLQSSQNVKKSYAAAVKSSHRTTNPVKCVPLGEKSFSQIIQQNIPPDHSYATLNCCDSSSDFRNHPTPDHSYATVNLPGNEIIDNQNQLHDHVLSSNSVGKDPNNSPPHSDLNHDQCLSISAEHTSNSLSKKRKCNKTLQSSPSSKAHTDTSQSAKPLRKVRRVYSEGQTNERQFLQPNQISEKK